jgi:hypothetical protein
MKRNVDVMFRVRIPAGTELTKAIADEIVAVSGGSIASVRELRDRLEGGGTVTIQQQLGAHWAEDPTGPQVRRLTQHPDFNPSWVQSDDPEAFEAFAQISQEAAAWARAIADRVQGR